MRLVITDNEGVCVDVPYDMVSVNVCEKTNAILIGSITNNDDFGYWETEPYDSRTKANAVMGMIHAAYEMDKKIFRFPMNEEVDIT